MGKMTAWLKKHMPSTRRLVQLYAALLYNAHIRGFIDGKLFQGNTKALCVPGLNCYSCPGAIGACPLGALQNALAAAKHTAPWYVLGILLLYGIMLGRTICGWLCPLGLIQELLHRIPTPKIRKSRITRALSWLKYIVLAVFVIALPLIYGAANNLPLPAFCKYICPAGTLEGAGGLLANPNNTDLFSQLGILFTRKSVILMVLFLACVFCYRAFCRFLCPLGAIYGLFNRFAFTGVRVDPHRCNHCGACVRHCEMDIRHIGDHECISCGKCMAHCVQGAVSLKCGRITLMGPETGRNADPAPVIRKRKQRGRIAWGILLAVLVFAVVYFNTQNATEAAPESGTPAVAEREAAADRTSALSVGPEVGNQLADFTVSLLDGSTFHLADYRGKVVFINEWATWCTPCVGELPYFEQLQEEHPEIVVLAFHHEMEVHPTAEEYIREKGWSDWQIRFGKDDASLGLNALIGGDSALPRTVVLNRRGEVIYNEQHSLTPEMLARLLEKAKSQE